jgi:OmpA-OmpF porin, OOP family
MATLPPRPERTWRLRRYRRVSRASIPFFPIGFAAVLGLIGVGWFALVPFAQLRIEGTIREGAKARLEAAGLDWVEVGVSGQTVVLTGVPPAPEDADRAVEVVGGLTVPTWAGPLSPIQGVMARFEEAPPPEPPGPPPVVWTEWEFRLERGVLALTGTVPDDETRHRVVGAANKAVDPPRVSSVRDNLEVLGQPAAEVVSALAVRGVDTLGRCTTGVARLGSASGPAEFSLRCEIEEAELEAVRTAAAADAAPALLGRIELVPVERIAGCEQALDAALAARPIRFAAASAAPDPEDLAALDPLVEAARACPGTLRIVGPSDDPPESALATARAESLRAALVDRGIAPDRLRAAGVGPEGPTRRVELDVVRSTEP